MGMQCICVVHWRQPHSTMVWGLSAPNSDLDLVYVFGCTVCVCVEGGGLLISEPTEMCPQIFPIIDFSLSEVGQVYFSHSVLSSQQMEDINNKNRLLERHSLLPRFSVFDISLRFPQSTTVKMDEKKINISHFVSRVNMPVIDTVKNF